MKQKQNKKKQLKKSIKNRVFFFFLTFLFNYEASNIKAMPQDLRNETS
jgi:hypothetical protein